MSEKIPRSGFDDFTDLLLRYGKVIAWVTGSSVILPAAMYAVDVLPPWPPGVVLVTGIMQVAVMIIAFQLSQLASRKSARRIMVSLSFLLALTSSAYFYMLSDYSFTGGPGKERQVKGFQCSSEALSIRRYAEKCPLLNEQLIATAEKADQLWTPRSITQARTLLLILWLATYGLFSAIITVLITFQSARPGRFIAR